MQAFIVTDENDERDALAFVIRHAGLAVATGSDVKRVMANWSQHPADLIVIAYDDDAHALEDVRAAREVSTAPLLLIVNPTPEYRHCQLLQAGADIVLQRPVALRLVARYAQVLLRRAASVPAFVLPTLELDDISLDPTTRTVSVGGSASRRLTQLEFRLMYVLMMNRNQVIPSDVIVERVWGHLGEGDRDLVRGVVSRLRHKIEPDPDNPRFIQTIPGVGYRFSVDDI